MSGVAMRRSMNQARMAETQQRAGAEFFPTMRQAPGFVSFTLIGSEDGVSEVVASEGRAAIRQQGIVALEEVEAVVLKMDGSFAVVRTSSAPASALGALRRQADQSN